MSPLGRRSLLGGCLVAAIVLVAPASATSVTPAGPASADLASPLVTVGPSPEPEPSREALAQAPQATNYAAAMVGAAHAAVPKGVTFGVSVLDLRTGQLAVTGTEQFYSASLSKLMLVVDMIDRGVEITPAVHDLITRALGPSDDEAMNVLWVKFDGADAMTRVADSLGMAATATADDRSQWGEVKVSPAGYARLYQHIMTEMDPADRDVIVTALSGAPPAAADGFNQSYGLLDAAPKAFAKQGWMYYGNQLYLHSAGVVANGSDRYVVVLMTSQASSSGVARANVSAIAAAVMGAMPATSPS
ncbi:serine hydrolase [Kibdelosporangium persicum]|uniref:serine hydrolase n=1 Tax=Kibdelosporangium persicum TaxID=2698649 RepID=UPI001564E865|nr:serine hydrolase [Kibdelosporangium persicum]